jgi:Ulp1 protease family, C-terminal catalytic domain
VCPSVNSYEDELDCDISDLALTEDQPLDMSSTLESSVSTLSLLTNTPETPSPILPAVTLANASLPHWNVGGVRLSLNDLKTISPEISPNDLKALQAVAFSAGEYFTPNYLTDAILDCSVAIMLQYTSAIAFTSNEVQMMMGPDGQEVHPGAWSQYDFVMFPVHQVNHWMLLVVSPSKRKLYFLDPAGINNLLCITQELLNKLNSVLMTNFGHSDIICPPKQEQSDSYNCGVFVIWYASQLAQNRDIENGLDPTTFRLNLLQQLWTHSEEYLLTLQ